MLWSLRVLSIRLPNMKMNGIIVMTTGKVKEVFNLTQEHTRVRWQDKRVLNNLRKHVRIYNLLIFSVRSIFDGFKNLHLLQRIQFFSGVKSIFFINTIFQLDTYLTLFFVLDLVFVDWTRFDPSVISHFVCSIP